MVCTTNGFFTCVSLNSRGWLWAGLCECLSRGSQTAWGTGGVLESRWGFIEYSTAGACLLGQLEPPGEGGVWGNWPRSLQRQTLGPRTQEAEVRGSCALDQP